MNRTDLFPVLPLAATLAACVANKKEPPKSGEGPLRAIAQASLVSARDTAPSCPAPGSVLDTGPAFVENGAKVAGRAVSVTCKVGKQAIGYMVEATVGLSDGSSVSVSSNVDDEGRSAAADVVVARVGGGTWTTDRCKLEPAAGRVPGVEPGRYAAVLNCRSAASPGNPTCDVGGTIRVEGCAQ